MAAATLVSTTALVMAQPASAGVSSDCPFSNSICFWQDMDTTGNMIYASYNVGDFAWSGFHDKTSSIDSMNPNRYAVYADAYYGGDSTWIPAYGHYDSLNWFWNDQIDSSRF
ncbi:peptidase inhibitor family I36 protein [Paenarthrobacter sp. NPDC018779]|uniref:peptidase inhibitor family I36 protein n=1 Tax=Paenarthrobacter sp. NPDC018779 TaxID=3364375 RepID=UPI0037C56BDB